MAEVENRIGPDAQSVLTVNGLPRKRILDCYTSLRFGGLARHMVTEVNGLQARGHDVYLAVQDDQGEFRSEVSPKVPVFGLGYQGPKSYIRVLWNLIRVVQQTRPQIIVSHAWSVDAMAILASRFLRPRPRIVLFYHTLIESTELECSWRQSLLKAVARQAYEYADAVVAVSLASKDGIVAHLGAPTERIYVIPNLWDMNRTLSGAREKLDDPWFTGSEIPVVLSCALLVPTKDFPTLLRAFALARQHYMARLAIVGDGPLKSTLLRLAEDLGVAEDFRILGYQSNPAKYMARASVFVLSSVVEGFGNVLVEALCLGVPIVATNVGGPSFVLDRGRYGLLVPPRDERSMAEAILTLLSDDSLRRRLAKMGPRRASAFAPDRTLDRIERVLLGLEPQEEN